MKNQVTYLPPKTEWMSMEELSFVCASDRSAGTEDFDYENFIW